MGCQYHFSANANQTNFSWQSIYKTPFQSLRETKLQSFQFKILYRIIPCNCYLKQLRIKENDICNYCNTQDIIQHFLYDCPRVQSLWSQFCSWFNRETHIDLNVSPEEYLLGVTHSHYNLTVVNTLLLYFKFFFHRRKLFHNCGLNLVSLLAEVKTKITSEEMICKIQNKNHHFDKWKSILLALG